MNPSELFGIELSSLVGLLFILVFFILILVFAIAGRKAPRRPLRPIAAFTRLGRAVGLAVEAGQRLHVSLGWGGVSGLRGMSALVGLSILQRVARAASISDRPPVASSGEGLLAILSQTTLNNSYRLIGAEGQYSPDSGQITGLTPFSYAAGTIPLVPDQQVSASILAGHFGSEVGLIAEAGERHGSLTLGGSDNLPAQAVLYAAAQEPLIGEELYAGGAYVQAGLAHHASLRAQDVMRWILILAILGGAAYKILLLTGVL